MEYTLREKIFGVLVFVLAVSAFFFWYQKDKSIESGAGVNTLFSAEVNHPEVLRESLAGSAQINGIIKSIGNGFLAVEADLVDLNKLEAVDFSKSQRLETVKKDYKVFADAKTAITSQGLQAGFADLKPGMAVRAVSPEAVYGVSEFKALNIDAFSINQ